MFLTTLASQVFEQSFPRVSGDVSFPKHFIISTNKFSPRERGCFLAYVLEQLP